MIDTIKKIAGQAQARLVAIRHHLHMYPELSFEEYKTASYIREELIRIGVDDISSLCTTGVVALIKGRNPESHCIALRADIDALPIHESNTAAYKSQHEGVMHACGHDVHTTCLLGAAMILNQLKNEFEGTIKLIFQPGEEKSPGGASLLIREGVLMHPPVKAIAALHVFPDLEAGHAGFRSGPYMASADEIHLTITGQPGHAALPHKAIDPITIAANIIASLQQVFSRKNNPLNPSVLSFGMIHGGSVTNVIPAEVKIKGTLRTFNESWRKDALQIIESTCDHICSLYGGSFHLDIPPGYPFLDNDPILTAVVQQSAIDYLGADKVHPLEMRMTAEDFSFYAQKVPACFFRLGTNLDNKRYTSSVHSSDFDVHEDCLGIGAGLMANAAIHMLHRAGR